MHRIGARACGVNITARRSFIPYDPIDIGINRASFFVAAYNSVHMQTSRTCFRPVQRTKAWIGDSIKLTIYVAARGRFEVHGVDVIARLISKERIIRYFGSAVANS